ncbi:hypothetical protein HL658_29400 [Azospirillum sp. RWY-5-1]|uniref:Tetratricopeptide repeat protein n=1 Tax=Azospirillum oleiclasticum TaxID=2735135 RepID=A0ABX2TLY5_9PROT|nr:hypothetical protein [Azospirillum oleiclasticum]NYZ16682.1 hypothetical protein [Azospirillum oleiclasticum]NYZ24169.1 hypothetical protein [Azospirillum oleiclasticum]
MPVPAFLRPLLDWMTRERNFLFGGIGAGIIVAVGQYVWGLAFPAPPSPPPPLVVVQVPQLAPPFDLHRLIEEHARAREEKARAEHATAEARREATEAAQRTRTREQQLVDIQAEIDALRRQQPSNLGLHLGTQSTLEREEQLLREALVLNENLERREELAEDYFQIARIRRMRRDYETAKGLLRQALAIDEKLDRKEGAARDHNNLGIVFEEDDDRMTAAGHYRTALALYRQLGMAREIAIVEGNLKAIGAEVPPP